jgi:hypothetical protein
MPADQRRGSNLNYLLSLSSVPVRVSISFVVLIRTSSFVAATAAVRWMVVTSKKANRALRIMVPPERGVGLSVSPALGQLFRNPAGAFGELKAQFTNWCATSSNSTGQRGNRRCRCRPRDRSYATMVTNSDWVCQDCAWEGAGKMLQVID